LIISKGVKGNGLRQGVEGVPNLGLTQTWIGNWFLNLFCNNHVLQMELKQTTIFLQKFSVSSLSQENCKLWQTIVLVCVNYMVVGWP
jgi:hypothetical protein